MSVLHKSGEKVHDSDYIYRHLSENKIGSVLYEVLAIICSKLKLDIIFSTAH